MAMIDEDPDVRALHTPDGLDWHQLSGPDAGFVAGWLEKERETQSDHPPSIALRESLLAGIWATEWLSSQAAKGWKKYIVFFSGVNAALIDENHSAVDSGIYLEWVIEVIEAYGWGPDGNASPLGKLHSECLSRWMRQPRRGPGGTVLPPSGDSARQAALDRVLHSIGEQAKGRHFGDIDPFDAFTITRVLREMSSDDAEMFVSQLVDSAIAADGWILYGAADAVMWARTDAETLPSYRKLLEAALRSQRARNFWHSDLSVKDIMFWRELNGGDDSWLPARRLPEEGQCNITALEVGEERVVAQLSPWADSNLVVVQRRDENEYVAINDMAQERGNPERGRVRHENDVATSLYNLYAAVGPQISMAPYIVDPEFEPFLRYQVPRLPE